MKKEELMACIDQAYEYAKKAIVMWNDFSMQQIRLRSANEKRKGESIKERVEALKMEIQVKEHERLEDGAHEGVIRSVEYRSKPLEYTDYLIQVGQMTIKASYPTNITPETIHGRLLTRFGFNIVAGSSVDPDKMINRHCMFTSVNKSTTQRGTYPEVQRDTLRPDLMTLETQAAYNQRHEIAEENVFKATQPIKEVGDIGHIQPSQ